MIQPIGILKESLALSTQFSTTITTTSITTSTKTTTPVNVVIINNNYQTLRQFVQKYRSDIAFTENDIFKILFKISMIAISLKNQKSSCILNEDNVVVSVKKKKKKYFPIIFF